MGRCRAHLLPLSCCALALGGLVATTAQAAHLRKGPYLVYGGQPTEMTVRWQTDATPSVGALLEWGLTPACELPALPASEDGAAADQHRFAVTLSNLVPGERYFYRVTVDSDVAQASFLAAPVPGSRAVVFYAYGDTRSNPAFHNTVANHILADVELAPDRQQTIVLHSGDWVANGGIEGSWDLEFFDRSQPRALAMMARLPVIGARGNHEDSADLLRKYWPFAYVTGANNACYYAFDYGPVHVTVIDQYADYSSGSAQYDWIVQDLASSPAPWKVALFHEPPYAAGGSHGDNTSTQQRLVPLFETYGVDLVIAGHNHHYARAVRNSIQYITTGGGGAGLTSVDPLAPYVQIVEAVHHFVRIAIVDNTLTYTAVRDDGSVIENLQLRHGIDSRPPLLMAASSVGDPGHVIVVFDEMVVPGSGPHGAENVANYGIPGVAVASALLDPSGSRVQLGVAPPLINGMRYLLGVRELADLAPQPNVMPFAQTIAFTHQSLPTPSVLIAIGDPWRYFKGTSIPGSLWASNDFDDSGWLVGPTGIGYGDGDDATVLDDMIDNYLTVYARRSFTVPDPAAVLELTLEIDYDDGFVAFINGNEVARRGVAANQTQNTAAASHESDPPESIDLTTRADTLQAGSNTLAIEVHNSSLGSSDLTLLPRLTMRATPPAVDGGVVQDGGGSPADAAGLDRAVADAGPMADSARSDLAASDRAAAIDAASGDAADARASAADTGSDAQVVNGSDIHDVAAGCACAGAAPAAPWIGAGILFALGWRRRWPTCR